MGTLALTGRSNLYDVMLLKAPNAAGALEVTNTLTEVNDLMNDLDNVPANGGLFHQGLRTTALPSGSLVDIGETWGSEKSKREPFVEGLATIRSSWEAATDELKTESAEVSQALVADEKKNFILGLGQAWMNLILQGPTAPTQNAIVGLMGRAPWKAVDNEYCYDCGGSSNLRSAWLVAPSISTIHLLYNPNHPTLGIEQEDKGESREPDPADAANKHRWILTIEFMLQQGICIRDQRSLKRIANIPCGISDYPGGDAINLAIIASLKHNIMSQRPWFMYCDADLYTKLVLASNDKLKVFMSDKNIYQTVLPMIGPNIIIRRMDALNYAVGSGEVEVN